MARFIAIILCALSIYVLGQRPAEAELESLVREGYQLMQEQKFEEAREKLTKAIRASGLQQSQDFHSLYFRAVCNFYLQDPKAAIEDVTRYLTMFPDSPRPYLLRATCYRNLDDTEGQLRDLDLALSRQPEEGEEVDPQILRWRGGLYIELQQFDAAEADIDRALAISRDPEGLSMKGFVQYSMGRYDSALLSVNQAIELDYTYVSSYLYGASFCLQEGDYGSALKYADLGLRVDDLNYRLWFYRGISLVETAMIDKGCSALNKAFYNGIDEAGDYLSEYCYKLDR